MHQATLTSKGQLTLPKDVRTRMGVAAGDRVAFILMEDGNYAIVPATQSVMALKGILRKPGNSVSLKDMDDAIAAAASE